MMPESGILEREAGLREWEIQSRDERRKCRKIRSAEEMVDNSAEQIELPLKTLVREEMNLCAEVAGCSRGVFGRVEIDSGYNLGFAVDMGLDSVVDIDDEGFQFEDASWAETEYWTYCDKGDGYSGKEKHQSRRRPMAEKPRA
jgi:hypothetical protein